MPRPSRGQERTPRATERRRPPDFDQYQEPGPLLRRCEQRARDVYRRVLGRAAPTRQQLAILIAAYQLEQPTQTRISARTGVDRNTIAGMLPRLMDRGLMERTPIPEDSRAWELRLTSKGRDLVEKLVPLAAEVQEAILAPVPEELRPAFIRCLRLIAGVEEARAHAPSAQPREAAQ